MSDPKTPEPASPLDPSSPPGPAEEEPRSTPFDNPYFLPALLLGLGLWFAYDGWLNPGIESVRFNRVGAILLLAGAAFTGWRAWRENRTRDASSARTD